MKLSTLYALWEELGDIPTNWSGEIATARQSTRPVLRIDAPFLNFPVGTSCEDIWHWFEAQNPAFVAGEVMQGRRQASIAPSPFNF